MTLNTVVLLQRMTKKKSRKIFLKNISFAVLSVVISAKGKVIEKA